MIPSYIRLAYSATYPPICTLKQLSSHCEFIFILCFLDGYCLQSIITCGIKLELAYMTWIITNTHLSTFLTLFLEGLGKLVEDMPL